MIDKVAIVTGANQGIGFAIVRELSKRGVKFVYLGSRDAKKGQDAIARLKTEGLNAQLLQIEVTSEESVKEAALFIKSKHGGLDILVNNAGVISADLYNTSYKDADNVINVNYKSIITIQKHFFPILKDKARVINVASDCGHISNLKNKNWINILTNDNLQQNEIDSFVEWFLKCVKENTLKDEDFTEMPMLAYRISKVALCALTRVQQKVVSRDISINCLHPGFVQTSMTKNLGMLTMDEAGKAPAYLALDVDQSVKGKYFWFDKTQKDWTDPTLPLYCQFKYFDELLKTLKN